MKLLKIIFVLSIFVSCSVEDDYVPFEVEQVFSENLDRIIKIDIVYVQSSLRSNQTSYNLDETHFINNLNGSFFHRYGIGFEMGEIKTMINDELYDLRDNRNTESSTFLRETQDSYNENRVSIYIIKRAHTIAIAGIGKDQRALITDEFLYKTTAPHEIGHALGLFHYPEEGNIMSEIRPYLRKEFTRAQIDRMKNRINEIKSQS